MWGEIIRLLEDPGLIQTEIDHRREAAQKADPLRKPEEELRREQARVEKSSERLVTAYQEGLLTLPQLRQRMPSLQKQTQAVESELQSLKMTAVDEAKYLQLAENLAGFRRKLRVRAEVLDIAVRQQILRLLVKEVLVGGNTITLRHSIPIPQSGPGSNGLPGPVSAVTGSRPKVGAEVDVNDSSLLLDNRLGYPVHRLMRCPFRTISVRPRLEIGFEDRLQNELECPLNHAVADSRNRKNADFLTPVLGNILLPCPHGPIRVVDQFIPYLLQKTFHSTFLDGLERDSVNPGCPRGYFLPSHRLPESFPSCRHGRTGPRNAKLAPPLP